MPCLTLYTVRMDTVRWPQFTFRLSTAERATLDKAAKIKKQTTAEFVREGSLKRAASVIRRGAARKAAQSSALAPTSAQEAQEGA